MVPGLELDGYWTDPTFILGNQLTTKSDVYSFGYILWEMYTKEVPFENMSYQNIAKRIKSGKFIEIPATVPAEMKDLILQCWSYMPDDRPNLDELISQLNEMS